MEIATVTTPTNSKYPYKSGSTSESPQTWLGFLTKLEADNHATRMNKLLETFDDTWNKTYWTLKPNPWVVIGTSGEK